MDLSALNNAVLNTWGEKLQVKVGTITHSNIVGVYADAYAKTSVGNTDVERPDPSFSFKTSDYNQLAPAVDDQVIYQGVTYAIISAPIYETGNWCNVMVRVY